MVRQGETVWAKHRNKRYYKAKVNSIKDTLFYMVTFSDASFSDDLYPSDITVSNRYCNSARNVLNCFYTNDH